MTTEEALLAALKAVELAYAKRWSEIRVTDSDSAIRAEAVWMCGELAGDIRGELKAILEAEDE